MNVRQIKPDVFYVGANHWDRRYFDELIHLPDGTSYNSYLIRGSEKNCLIDAVDPDLASQLLDNLSSFYLKRLDYIVCNHSEQDHSGVMVQLLELHPETIIVTNAKCKEMLQSHLLLPEEKIMVVKEGDTLSLGDKTLKFFIAPWVHWPDTMFTYLVESNILFTCDFLGAHLATSKLYADEDAEVYLSAKRYYSEIMMPFRSSIKKYVEKIRGLNVEIIAPSHGPLYNKPNFILDAYSDWSSDSVKNEVILPFVSMHGSTRKMVDFFIDELVKRGIMVKPINLAKTEIGTLAMSLVDAATIVIATPTVLTGAHPLAVYAVYLTNLLRPKLRFASMILSYGWGGKTGEQIMGMLSNVKLEYIDPVIAKGHPKEEDFESLSKLSDEIFKKHKEIGII